MSNLGDTKTSESIATEGNWIERGEHLPPLLRAQEAQRALFAVMHEDDRFCSQVSSKEITAASGQEYVFDVFLKFLAGHGFTLQRSNLSSASMSKIDRNEPIAARPLYPALAIARHLHLKQPKSQVCLAVDDRLISILQHQAVKKNAHQEG